ncbi:cysteine-rich CWC family protein [Janthinobacterium sp. HLX7-2]|uniref:cysteine-rich CWC family protein n=1 Tax=Janthinobacterium sp. HLX7-2 TaxID=1259331 RepID=UPI003F280DA6
MSQCSLCGATFQCGQLDPHASEPCWCTTLPPAVPMPGNTATACWCPACLQTHIASLGSDGKAPTSAK